MKFERRVTVYSFVLTCFVIWLHAGESLLTGIPGQIAVPGFFIMSGYLFFRNIPHDAPKDVPAVPEESSGVRADCDVCRPRAHLAAGCTAPGNGTGQGTARTENTAFAVIRRKLRSRVRTLLVPYLLWNTIYFLIYLVFGKAGLSEAPRAVFLYSCNPVFWYLWQLLLITALTPLLYLLLRRKVPGVLFLSAVFVLAVLNGSLPVHYCNEDALFYYSLGAFSALCYRDAVEKPQDDSGRKLLSRQFAGTLAVFLLSGILETALSMPYRLAGTILQRAFGAALIWFLIEGAGRFIVSGDDGSLPPFMNLNFFVYATHYMTIRAVWALEGALRLGESAAANIITYLLMPAFCIAAACGLHRVLRKFAPRVLLVLTGGR